MTRLSVRDKLLALLLALGAVGGLVATWRDSDHPLPPGGAARYAPLRDQPANPVAVAAYEAIGRDAVRATRDLAPAFIFSCEPQAPARPAVAAALHPFVARLAAANRLAGWQVHQVYPPRGPGAHEGVDDGDEQSPTGRVSLALLAVAQAGTQAAALQRHPQARAAATALVAAARRLLDVPGDLRSLVELQVAANCAVTQLLAALPPPRTWPPADLAALRAAAGGPPQVAALRDNLVRHRDAVWRDQARFRERAGMHPYGDQSAWAEAAYRGAIDPHLDAIAKTGRLADGTVTANAVDYQACPFEGAAMKWRVLGEGAPLPHFFHAESWAVYFAFNVFFDGLEQNSPRLARDPGLAAGVWHELARTLDRVAR